jgi:mannose-6-phosphate isomerase-like protein (cupin superfamily)
MKMDYTRLVAPPISKVLKSGRVSLAPGEEVGEHVTDRREEILIILEGTATVVQKGEERLLSAGETCFIPENTRHNVKNRSGSPITYIYAVSLFDA